MIIFFNKFKTYLKNNKWIFLVVLAIVVLPSLVYGGDVLGTVHLIGQGVIGGVKDFFNTAMHPFSSIKEGATGLNQISDGVVSYTLKQITGAIIASQLAMTDILLTASYYLLKLALHNVSMLFDNVIAISIMPDIFKMDFIETTWRNIRDFANIGFIFGAFYIVYQLIAGKEWHRTFLQLIVAILIMNFSLLAGRIIIDAGNLTTRVFYKSIGQEVLGVTYWYWFSQANIVANVTEGDDSAKNKKKFLSITGELMKGIEDKMTSNAYKKIDNSSSFLEPGVKAAGIAYYFFIFRLVTISLLLALVWHFFTVSIAILFRTISMLVYLIISPIFVLGHFFDFGENKDLGGEVSLSSWFKIMFVKSFCLVSYFFYIWFLLKILDADIFKTNEAGNSEIEVLTQITLALIMKSAFVLVILGTAKKTLKKECTEGVTGKLYDKANKVIIGTVSVAAQAGLAVATGGTSAVASVAGRAAVGRLGHSAMKTGTKMLGKKGTFNKIVGQGFHSFGEGVHERKWWDGKSYNQVADNSMKKKRHLQDQIRSHAGNNEANKWKWKSYFSVDDFHDEDWSIAKKAINKAVKKIEKYSDAEMNFMLDSFVKQFGKDLKKDKETGKWKLSGQLKKDIKKYGFDNSQEAEEFFQDIEEVGDTQDDILRKMNIAKYIKSSDEVPDTDKFLMKEDASESYSSGVIRSVADVFNLGNKEIVREEMEAARAKITNSEKKIAAKEDFLKKSANYGMLQQKLEDDGDTLKNIIMKGSRATTDDLDLAENLAKTSLGLSDGAAIGFVNNIKNNKNTPIANSIAKKELNEIIEKGFEGGEKDWEKANDILTELGFTEEERMETIEWMKDVKDQDRETIKELLEEEISKKSKVFETSIEESEKQIKQVKRWVNTKKSELKAMSELELADLSTELQGAVDKNKDIDIKASNPTTGDHLTSKKS